MLLLLYTACKYMTSCASIQNNIMATIFTRGDSMDTKLLKYYKKKMRGGRTLVARTVDFVLLRALLFFLVFVIVMYLSLSTTVALLISAFLTAAVSFAAMAYNKRKIEKYITNDLRRIKQKCLLEKLTFMGIDEYTDYINSMFDGKIAGIKQTEDGFHGSYEGEALFALHNHPGGECSVSDVLKVYRLFENEDKFILLSLAEISSEAKTMLSVIPKSVEIIGGKRLLEIAETKGMLPDEAEAEENAVKEMNATIVTLEKVKESAFSKAKVRGYIICGAVITAWPLITGFRIYYPIIAIACFAMAVITYKKSKQHDESSDAGVS